ncbi:MAG: hypothetical protein AVDCRST_MAG57-795, partial [uncultured Blastococcus sp.]
ADHPADRRATGRAGRPAGRADRGGPARAAPDPRRSGDLRQRLRHAPAPDLGRGRRGAGPRPLPGGAWVGRRRRSGTHGLRDPARRRRRTRPGGNAGRDVVPGGGAPGQREHPPRLDALRPPVVGHHGQCRGQVAAARALLRGLRVRPGQAADRWAEHPIPGRHRPARRPPRGGDPARCEAGGRHLPRLRRLQRDRRRMGRGEGRPGSAPAGI